MSTHSTNLDAMATVCETVGEAVHLYGTRKDQLAKDIRGILSERDELIAACCALVAVTDEDFLGVGTFHRRACSTRNTALDIARLAIQRATEGRT